MTNPSDTRLIRFRLISKALAVVVILVGGIVLVGWELDISILKSFFWAGSTMQVNIALAFLLAGLSLYMQEGDSRHSWRGSLAYGCAGIVILIGFFTVGEYLFGRDLGIDRIFLKSSPQPPKWPFQVE